MLKGIKATVDKGIAAVSVKSESLVESSRTRTAIDAMQKNMDAELSALGVLYFNSWISGAIVQETLDERCQAIKNIQAELTSLQARLEQIKEEENQRLGIQRKSAGEVVFCRSCGRQLSAGAKFCDACGTQIQK